MTGVGGWAIMLLAVKTEVAVWKYIGYAAFITWVVVGVTMAESTQVMARAVIGTFFGEYICHPNPSIMPLLGGPLMTHLLAGAGIMQSSPGILVRKSSSQSNQLFSLSLSLSLSESTASIETPNRIDHYMIIYPNRSLLYLSSQAICHCL